MNYLNVDELYFLPGECRFYSSSRKEHEKFTEAFSNGYGIEIYTEGSAKFQINDEEYLFEAGSILIRKPGTHLIQDKSYLYESYAIGLVVKERKTGEMLMFPGESCCFLDQLPVKVIPEDFSAFLKILKKINNIQLNKNTEQNQLICNSVLNEILLLLYPYCNTAKGNTDYTHPVIRKAISFFRINIDTPTSMKEVAEYAGVSEKYFIQLFKNYTGKTPNVYFMEQRLDLAVKKLETTNQPISEIAYESGFSSCTYFGYIFKKYYQKTPSEFRKGHKFPS